VTQTQPAVDGPIFRDAVAFRPEENGLACGAVYERTIGASLTRVWENVLDWEHLPHLHAGSFASLSLEAAGAWGWRARLASANNPTDTFVTELVIDKDANRYVARTLEGGLQGTEIWTTLSPRSAHETDIHVEYWVPDSLGDAVEKVGQAHVAVYETLWSEDEDMMVYREGALQRRTGKSTASIDLGPLEDLKAQLPLVLDFDGQKVRIDEVEGELVAFSARCPHMLGPLEDAPIKNGCVTCPWHGYQFDVRTGRSVDGRKLKLSQVAAIDVDAGTQRVRLRAATDHLPV